MKEVGQRKYQFVRFALFM